MSPEIDVHGGVDSARGQLQETSPSNHLATIDLTSNVRFRPIDRAVYFLTSSDGIDPLQPKARFSVADDLTDCHSDLPVLCLIAEFFSLC